MGPNIPGLSHTNTYKNGGAGLAFVFCGGGGGPRTGFWGGAPFIWGRGALLYFRPPTSGGAKTRRGLGPGDPPPPDLLHDSPPPLGGRVLPFFFPWGAPHLIFFGGGGPFAPGGCRGLFVSKHEGGGGVWGPYWLSPGKEWEWGVGEGTRKRLLGGRPKFNWGKQRLTGPAPPPNSVGGGWHGVFFFSTTKTQPECRNPPGASPCKNFFFFPSHKKRGGRWGGLGGQGLSRE